MINIKTSRTHRSHAVNEIVTDFYRHRGLSWSVLFGSKIQMAKAREAWLWQRNENQYNFHWNNRKWATNHPSTRRCLGGIPLHALLIERAVSGYNLLIGAAHWVQLGTAGYTCPVSTTTTASPPGQACPHWPTLANTIITLSAPTWRLITHYHCTPQWAHVTRDWSSHWHQPTIILQQWSGHSVYNK